ncbi:MAG: type II toxin-antitoxin system RelE/ParE family toxin [bacterium]|nr:type II toxin-antitoxin system RelE/ParE family toxin [bacterium]
MGTGEKKDSEERINYSITLTPQSYFDLENSYQWYSDQETNFVSNFLKEIEICFEKIRSNPYSYQLIKNNLHRATTRKFPFGIFFKIDNNEIIIFAVFHLSRDPQRF